MAGLTPEERALVARYVQHGDVVLREKGWDKEKRTLFLSKKAVRKELESIEASYKDRDGVAERVRFCAMLEIHKMVPAAIDTLRRQLLTGREVNGVVQEPPAEQAYQASLEILRRSGIDHNKVSDAETIPHLVGDITVAQFNMANGSDAFGKTLSRERLRTVISSMLTRKMKSVKVKVKEPKDEKSVKRLTPPDTEEG